MTFLSCIHQTEISQMYPKIPLPAPLLLVSATLLVFDWKVLWKLFTGFFHFPSLGNTTRRCLFPSSCFLFSQLPVPPPHWHWFNNKLLSEESTANSVYLKPEVNRICRVPEIIFYVFLLTCLHIDLFPLDLN